MYVALVAVSGGMPGMRWTLGLGVAATLLVLLGHLVSPPDERQSMAVANRSLAIAAIWLTAALVARVKRRDARAELAEQRAWHAERQFRATVEACPCGMLLVDRQGRITLANREVERLFGYAGDGLLGRAVETLVPELDRAGHARRRAGFVADAASRRMGAGREVTGVDRHGRALTLEVGLARIDTPDGEFVLATVVDIGERKLLEQARGAQSLALRLIDAEEAQRKRMAREIHDALGQALTALKLDIGWLARHLPAEQAGLRERARAMEDLTARTIEDVRRLSAELRPAILDDQGLLAAIRWQVGDFEQRSGLRCSLALPDTDIAWGDERSTVAFRVLQESLTNVARHAQAHDVVVALWLDPPSHAVLEVRDDGRGIGAGDAARPGALGLVGMRERALLNDGTLTVSAANGPGTTVALRMPTGPGRPAMAAGAPRPAPAGVR